jgi:hypothetical protein
LIPYALQNIFCHPMYRHSMILLDKVRDLLPIVSYSQEKIRWYKYIIEMIGGTSLIVNCCRKLQYLLYQHHFHLLQQSTIHQLRHLWQRRVRDLGKLTLLVLFWICLHIQIKSVIQIALSWFY